MVKKNSVFKKKSFIITAVIVAVVIIIGGWFIGTYNSMVRANEAVDGKWSQVETDLQRRADLIPNLVNTVKGYASHENEIFQQVSDARARLMGASTPQATLEANDALTTGLGRLLAIVENYPNLKANTNFIQLQDELAGTENRIAVSRKDYNNQVRNFNQGIKTFPRNLLAGMFGFAERTYFEAESGKKDTPVVDFN